MDERRKLLQIIHISDLHVCENYSDKALVAKQARWLRMRQATEKHNLSEWHEGTLSHDDTAERAFSRFLRELKANDKDWFGTDGSTAQTWLIDTGDLTTFGDTSSIAAGQAKLLAWRGDLGNCPMRVLFGNHDLWPGTQPIFAVGRWAQTIGAQKKLVEKWDEWRPERWLQPLSVDIPDINIRIDLYALNSACYGWVDGIMAVGRLPNTALRKLIKKIQNPAGATDRKCYRILATHHPLVFPFGQEETSLLTISGIKKVLKNSQAAIDALRNDLVEEGEPYIHLFLSGHTHFGFPGGPLPHTVKEAYQGSLGIRQMQLVGGPLFLVRDRNRVKKDIGPKVVTKNNEDFAKPMVYDWNQQFQILRFYYAPDKSAGLILERFVMARVGNDGAYRSVPELHSEETSILF